MPIVYFRRVCVCVTGLDKFTVHLLLLLLQTGRIWTLNFHQNSLACDIETFRKVKYSNPAVGLVSFEG